MAGHSDRRRRTYARRIVLTGLLLLGDASGHAVAQAVGDATAGRALAEKWCSACHLVTPDQPTATSSGAPTFPAIARMKATTRLSLGVFLQTPHDRMPNLHLNRNEIDDLSAYILSLRRR